MSDLNTPVTIVGTRRLRSRSVRLISLMAVLVVIAAACGGGDSGSDAKASGSTSTIEPEGGTPSEGPNTPAPRPLATREKVTVVSVGAIENFASPYLALAMGEFEKENIEVDIQAKPIADGTIMLAQGAADVQMNGIAPATLNQIAQGGSLRYVTSTFLADASEAGFYISKEYLDAKGEPDLAKLKGARVNTGRGGGGFGNPGALPLWQWFQEVGLKTTDVEVVDLPSAPDVAAALVNGSIAIGIGLTPAWQQIVESDCCQLLVPNPVSGVYVSTTQFLEDRSEVAKAFFRAILRTNRTYLSGDYKKNPEVVNALAAAFQVPPDSLTATPPLTFSDDLESKAEELVEPFQEFYRSNDLLSYEKDFARDELIDRSIIEEVLKEE